MCAGTIVHRGPVHVRRTFARSMHPPDRVVLHDVAVAGTVGFRSVVPVAVICGVVLTVDHEPVLGARVIRLDRMPVGVAPGLAGNPLPSSGRLGVAGVVMVLPRANPGPDIWGR